jgi:hypothetical protein
MWSQSAKPPEHKNNAADPEHWKVDTEKMEDPAAEFRKQVTSFTCFTGTVYLLYLEFWNGHEVYLLYWLYWYTSTNTDAAQTVLQQAAAGAGVPREADGAGLTTHFTCFTSTKVQILTPEELRSSTA